MLQAIKFALKCSYVVPEVVELVGIVNNASPDGFTKEEKSKLMSKYWSLVKTIQKTTQARGVLASIPSLSTSSLSSTYLSSVPYSYCVQRDNTCDYDSSKEQGDQQSLLSGLDIY